MVAHADMLKKLSKMLMEEDTILYPTLDSLKESSEEVGKDENN